VAALLAIGAIFERRPRGHRAWLAAIPIVGVNSVAFYGQLSYFESHRHVQPGIVIPQAVSVVAALALESIAIYLAWQAHLAQLADDSALRLRLGAYGVALGIGALNYSHFCAPGWRPTPFAVVFAASSAISPWLWSIHSRRESRDALKARNLIEDHAVRLGATRWFWHAYRCVRVMWAATWTGETNPARAIALIEPEPARAATPAPARRQAAVRAPRLTELTAGREQAEREIALELAAMAVLPASRGLAAHEKLAGFGSLATRRRAADRLLAAARAERNGGGAHGDGGS
jgi:hypothetical protein